MEKSGLCDLGSYLNQEVTEDKSPDFLSEFQLTITEPGFFIP